MTGLVRGAVGRVGGAVVRREPMRVETWDVSRDGVIGKAVKVGGCVVS